MVHSFGGHFMSILNPSHVHLPFLGRTRFSHDHAPTPATRSLSCPHCGEPLRVPARAINTRCTACLKHVLLEDVVIRGDSIRTHIITTGTILVEPSARFAGILQASEIVVAGRVLGTVIATERVQVTATGKIAGTVATRALQAHPLALIDGQIHILNADNSVSTTTSHR